MELDAPAARVVFRTADEPASAPDATSVRLGDLVADVLFASTGEAP